MIGIILTGYGKFAEGLKDAMEAVCGPADCLETVSFNPSDTEESFSCRLEEAKKKLSECENLLYLCDMTGGIPYRLATDEAEACQSEVLAGVNLGMLIEGSISRQFTPDIHQLASQIFNIGQDQVERYKNCPAACTEKRN